MSPTSVQSAPHLVEVVVVVVVVTVVVVVVVVVVEVVVVTVVLVVVVAVVVVPMQPQGFASYKAKWKGGRSSLKGGKDSGFSLNEDKRLHLARNWVTGDPAEGETLDGAGLSAWSICI